MTIIHKPTFSRQLKQIIEHIALDKPSASMKFKNELKETINLLSDHPLKCRKSIYFDNENISFILHSLGSIISYRLS
jgi:plasmid stabilization system protein ParE